MDNMANDPQLTDETLDETFEEDWDNEDDEWDPDAPDPYLVQHHLEKGLRIELAYYYSDDLKIRELLEEAIPLVEEANALNEQKIKGLEGLK